MSWFRLRGASRRGGDGNGFLAGILPRSLNLSRKFQRSRGSRPARRGCDEHGSRLLRIDALENRCLLTVGTTDLTAMLANQTFGSAQVTTTGHSIASDSSGDFVVTWTKASEVLDTNGNPVVNPTTGNPLIQNNVYARYFTDEVQRVILPGTGTYNNNNQFLPNGIATNFDDDANTVGHFSLTFNAETVMQISVTAGVAPEGDPNGTPGATNVAGQFTLGFDPTGADPTNVNNFQLMNIVYNETDPALAAAQIQKWLRSMPVDPGISDATYVTVNAIDPHTFVVDFGADTQGLDQSSLLKFVNTPPTATLTPTTTLYSPAAVFTLSGFLPAVQVTTLDRPFTVNNIPVSQTDPNQTAQAIETYFQQRVASFSTGVAPFDFPTPQRVGDMEAPYVAPVSTNVNKNPVPTPVSGFDPTITVLPIVNPDGTLSYTTFDVTFTGVSVRQIEPEMVVTNCTDENLVPIGATIPGPEAGPAGTVPIGSTDAQVPIGSTEAQVKILKQTGNEFEVNEPQPYSVYALTPQPLNNSQSSVAMDASGDFVIAWTGAVSQEFSPKDVTDIYFRHYTPVGVTDSFSPGTYVPGAVTSDIVTPGEAVTDPAEYLAQSFTGVRTLPNPNIAQKQRLEFDSTAGVPVQGTFELQIGTVLTAPITFNSNDLGSDLTGTATNIQNSLVAAGYQGVTVVNVLPSVQPGKPTRFLFDVTFGGNSTGTDEPPIQYVPTPTNAATTPPTVLLPVQFTQSLLTADMYTEQANVNYTNPQMEPSVAIDPVGNFVIAWANQGQDVSFFNNIDFQRFDNEGNPVGTVIQVNNELTSIEIMPDVAMGQDDYVVVTWTHTDDPSFLVNGNALATALARAFDPQNNPIENEFYVGGGGDSSVAMDGQDNYVISWQAAGLDGVDLDGSLSAGVFGREFQLLNYATHQPILNFNPDGLLALQKAPVGNWTYGMAAPAGDTVGNQLIRDIFRISSASFETTNPNAPPAVAPYPANPASPKFTATSTWPFDQEAAQVAIDIDGDIASTFEGDGPAVSENIMVPSSFFVQYFRDPATGQPINTDLLPYFNPLQGTANGTTGYMLPGSSSSGVLYQFDEANVDTAIDQILYNAEYPSAATAANPNPPPPATTEQLGRLRAILENVAGLLRGDSGVELTRIDAGAGSSTNYFNNSATYSDSVVNSQREGTDQRIYLLMPPDAETGSITLNVATGAGDPYITNPVSRTFTVQVPANGNFVPYNSAGFLLNLEIGLDNVLGNIYLANGTNLGGSVDVREVPTENLGGVIGALPGALSALAIQLGIPGGATPSYVDEVTARVGTDWQIVNQAGDTALFGPGPFGTFGNYYPSPQVGFFQQPIDAWYGYTLYEITFQGEMHDVPMTLAEVSQTLTYMQRQTPLPGNPPTQPPPIPVASQPVAFLALNGAEGDYVGNDGNMNNGGTTQYNASLTMTPEGDIIADYTNQTLETNGTIPLNADGNPTDSNIYYRRMSETTNTAGPRVVGWTSANGIDLLNVTGTATNVNSQYMVLTFDEPLTTGDPTVNPDSVYDTANYQIIDSNGDLLPNAVTHVDYGLSEVAQMAGTYGMDPIPTNKWEVILTIDGNSSDPGDQPLADGTYTLKVLNAIPASSTTAGQAGIRNIYGTPLNLTGYNPTGSNYVATITISSSSNPGGIATSPGLAARDKPINSVRGGQQVDPAVATQNDLNGTAFDGNGNYVVVWTSIVGNQTSIVGQLYNAAGTKKGGEFVIANGSTSWSNPDVAMDADGDFIVTWSGALPGSNPTTDPSDVSAREFYANGQAVGAQFEVDQHTSAVQNQARVAMGPDGAFVITWTSTPITTSNINATNSVIYAREYGPLSLPISTEFQVSSTSAYAQTYSDVAMDGTDDFVVVWEGDFQSQTWGIYGDYFTAIHIPTTTVPTGWTQTGPALLNNSPNTRGSFTGVSTIDLVDTGPRVGMDTAGDFVVTWADFTNPSSGYDIYAQQFKAGGKAAANAFMVNNDNATDLAGWQLMPDVGVDAAGDFTIVWTSYGQDNASIGNPGTNDYGVYARMYLHTGADYTYTDPTTGKVVTPLVYRVNATTLGDQVAPAVSRQDIDDDSIMAWVGPDTNAGTTAIYLRNVDPPASIVVPVKPAISVSNATAAVGALGTQITFTVSLSATTTNAVRVNYSTEDGTAKADINYSPVSGVLAFPPGQKTSTITVDVAGMPSSASRDLTLLLNLTNPTNGTLAQASATGTLASTAPVVNTAPVVASNPSSQTVNAGQSVNFSAGAGGTPTPTVQWQVSTNGGTTFANITGATSTTYTIESPSAAQSGYEYQAVFTNSVGSVTTTAATLTVLNTARPVVTTNPVSQSVNAGHSVSFTAAASGTPTPTVQWQVSTNGGKTFANITFGATSATYTIAAPTTAQSGYEYRAVFTNAIGTATTTPAKLTVVKPTPPVLTANPSNQAVVVGKPATFTAAANGAATVQWQVSTNGGKTFVNISGATSTTYSIAKTTAAQSGYEYRAVFANTAGSVTTKAVMLTISSPPVVKTSPLSRTVSAGKSASFTATAGGTPTPTVQWQVSTNGGTTFTNIKGATSTTYTIAKTTAAQSGYEYRAVFTNAGGTATTQAATLTVASTTKGTAAAVTTVGQSASSTSTVHASTVSGQTVTNLTNSITSLNPTAVGAVMATRL